MKKQSEIAIHALDTLQDPQLDTVGKVSAALLAIDEVEARNRHAKLIQLGVAYERSIAESEAAREASARLVEFKRISGMVGAICDGAVAKVAFLRPERAPDLPRKTGLEKQDPTAYAEQVIEALSKGNEAEQLEARQLSKVLERYEQEQKEAAALNADRSTAAKEIKVARLALHSYAMDCKAWITKNVPDGHDAHGHLKRKRPGKKPQGAPTGAQPGTVTPPAPIAAPQNTPPQLEVVPRSEPHSPQVA